MIERYVTRAITSKYKRLVGLVGGLFDTGAVSEDFGLIL